MTNKLKVNSFWFVCGKKILIKKDNFMASNRQISKHSLLKTLAYDPTDAVMGLDTNGEVFHTPLSKGPHWLVCGFDFY